MNKGLKIIMQVVLGLVVVALAWVLWRQIMNPLEFDKEVEVRKAAVIARVVDIRSAEQAFKQKSGHYTGSFDSLIAFVLRDSLDFERRLVDENDSVGMARLKQSGRENVQKFAMAVRDTIFSPRKLTNQQIEDLRFIPYAPGGTQFILNASMLTTESKVVVPVFEAKAPYKEFLGDMDHQLLVNLIDNDKNVFNKYPGIAVGSVERATNDAGNWE